MEVQVFDGETWATEEIPQPPASSYGPVEFAGFNRQPDGSPSFLMSLPVHTPNIHGYIPMVEFWESHRSNETWSTVRWLTGSLGDDEQRGKVHDWEYMSWGRAFIFQYWFLSAPDNNP